MIEKIIEKLMSGKFLLTIMAGVAFIIMITNGTINPQASTAIIMGVFTNYFNKRSDNGNK